MLTIISLLMVLMFVYTLAKNKLSILGALTLVPMFAGILVVILTGANISDLFTWIFEGLFYKVNEATGSVSIGVISPGLLILFAVFYFDVMLDVGLFDPMVEFFIKSAKGDPLKVTIATVLTCTVVSMDGDTTTTIIIMVAAFLVLYKQLNMKLGYLAILTVAPIGIFNQLPWGGPTIASATAMEVSLNELFVALLPGMIGALLFVIFVAYIIGKKERARLGWQKVEGDAVNSELIEQMLESIRNNNPELKRPKLIYFNLIITLVSLYLLIVDIAHGSIIFMIASALALTVNYRDVKLINERIDCIAPDALAPALATFGAGVFSGILTGSGMADALAQSITMLIPEGMNGVITPIYSLASIPLSVYLPQDAFYFGIAKVVSGVLSEFGVTSLQVAVASMVGQSFRLISPVIPALYMLVEQTEINFIDFQKLYAKYFLPLALIYLAIYFIFGFIPVG